MSSCVRRVQLAQLLYVAAWGTNDTNLKPRWRHTQSCKNIRIGNFYLTNKCDLTSTTHYAVLNTL